MKFLIVGAGGVGGVFGARLAADGNDVTFVARGAHREAMAKHGLKVLREAGDIHIENPKLYAVLSEITERAKRDPAMAEAVLQAMARKLKREHLEIAPQLDRPRLAHVANADVAVRELRAAARSALEPSARGRFGPNRRSAATLCG